MYEVLCTCITAPLEGSPVDKAKYSENVGHHLVCWICVIQRAEKKGAYQNELVATRRAMRNQMQTGALHGSHPMTRRGSAKAKDNKGALEISSTYLNW